ncbi:biotin-dependent carboxyltransferase family protein [Kroppenstedtia pulmonis]|uniref:Biotin-dependent carboxyltransferase family protein n=1 Tax=Kroppenstedtia pulmonis TaxID=1380685 RepID=A0A7D3Y1J8_9BACL|nr:biotin-dependent carboxyltransferase family protein [Kroppenstedtia pulmonis]QKG85420.1 biotin-dependent carboxyltransferase family protein [Kroppenstedtia pulmonis]
MADGIQVLKPGLLTTIQDLGRMGYQQYGLSVTGAMDTYALQVGNLLVGNPRDEAGLEITLTGPVLQFDQALIIALTGGDLGATLDGTPAPLWKSIQVKRGQVLRFHGAVQGVRAYLSVAGGFDVPKVMDSKSTDLRAKIGGYAGRALQRGDRLKVGRARTVPSIRQLAHDQKPVYQRHIRLRVILGPQCGAFTAHGVHVFLQERFTVSSQSDRMGYRLTGPRIQHRGSADIISDAIAPGSVQVPADGQPIILMADRQPTGGYTKIATVISNDLPYLAQASPGDTLSFEPVKVEQARYWAIEQEKFLRKLELVTRC